VKYDKLDRIKAEINEEKHKYRQLDKLLREGDRQNKEEFMNIVEITQ
jgi:hypothetical protein